MRHASLLGLVKLALIGALLAWGAWYTQHWTHPNDRPIHWALVVFAGLALLQFTWLVLVLAVKLIYRRIIMLPTDRSGSARWATYRDIKKAGLFRRKGVLAGLKDRRPVFVDIESAGLVLSPAGGGKTVNFVVPALCADPTSMLVTDLKGSISCMTAKLRQKKHGHDTVCVNPSGQYVDIVGQSAHYNPLQILVDDWANPALHSLLYADAMAIAKQMRPEPDRAGENEFFRNASRKMLAFAFLYLVTIESRPQLAEALSLLSDVERLLLCLNRAKQTDYLSGDLALLATDLLRKFEKGDPKQIESFREGAVQVLEIYSQSGSLAESTSKCDFRFHDMRDKDMTIYLMGDPTRASVYQPWLALLSWCALTELIRYQNHTPVCFMLDEITNFKIEGLNLTLLREFKIKAWLIVQELEEWAKTYGRESLNTLLSQTPVKLIFDTADYQTCRLVENMLGNATIKTKNYNLGASLFDDPTVSVQDNPRPLKTADEVRRTAKAILFVGKQPPVELDKIGYHEIRPWSKWIGINPLFGKRFKGRTRLRL